MNSRQRALSRETPTGPGFTLMEILVALALAAIVATSVFAVFDRTLDVGGEIEESVPALQMLRMTLDRLATDLHCLAFPGGSGRDNATGEQAGNIFGFQGVSPDSAFFPEDNGSGVVLLAFSTWSCLDTGTEIPRGRLNRVEYVLRQDFGRMVLVRKERIFARMPSCKAVGSVELADGVQDVRLVFVDRQGMTHDEWNMEEEGRDLPAMVRCRLSCDLDSGDFGPWTLERSVHPGFMAQSDEEDGHE
jgi:type II secretion system protein J